MAEFYRQLLSQLLLLVPASKFQPPSLDDPEPHTEVIDVVNAILAGNSGSIFTDRRYKEIFYNPNGLRVLSQYPNISLKSALHGYVDEIIKSMDQSSSTDARLVVQLAAIAALQLFIQLNFTGPNVEFKAHELLMPHADHEKLHMDLIDLLTVEGQSAYELMNEPLLFIIASLMFEKSMGVAPQYSFIGKDKNVELDQMVEATRPLVESPTIENGSLFWWRSRALQIHISLLSEPPSVLTSISALLLGPSTAEVLAHGNDVLSSLVKYEFLIETARASIHSYTEHLAISLLARASEVTELQFVLTGAKAKRTKFQTFTTSSLVLLAKSKGSTLLDEDTAEEPAKFNLDSDLLLERPQYDALEDIKEPLPKKTKFEGEDPNNEVTLLPIARHQDQIPLELSELDPNDQPALNDLDNLQLLLRLMVLRQSSPASNSLVEEELMAIASRVIYQPSKAVNWAIFGRALWERSLLETSKARTVERGILQMTSLVEEIGLKIKTRLLPQETDTNNTSPAASRLRFIHQLPLMPQWTMDVKLAEKYMSLGVLKSALEIYERLHLECEVALCHAAVDNETEAENVLLRRLEQHPNDARATSILGDIRQDPQLWERAWEIGRYPKAKNSLSRYYYNPPANSGLSKDLEAALLHMGDCLKADPLNFENWFFYGCCGLETANYELASEAFTRCISLDDSNSHAWSNLATALLRLDKTRPAFNALKKAMVSSKEGKRSWRIHENFVIVAMKLNEWSDVLQATRELIDMKEGGESSIDIPVIEKLVEILVATDYPKEGERLTHYQSSCIDLVCNMLPNVITNSGRCWRIVARVHIWRKRPWEALECYEKAYRAVSQKHDLSTDETIWKEAVEACEDLVAAYESLGELPGKHGADDVVCKDWKYKSKTTIRSLMSKGKQMWEDSEGWDRLISLKENL
ncbi:Essential for maintenance of the cell wall protein 1 [Meyerozyma sp. JA9]|nr:Essential for maintenance of the cell wall protein 1 [Meyerozyma sp. JA9]